MCGVASAVELKHCMIHPDEHCHVTPVDKVEVHNQHVATQGSDAMLFHVSLQALLITVRRDLCLSCHALAYDFA